MSTIGETSQGIKIDPARLLSLKDMMAADADKPVQEFDAGHGIKVQRQGSMIKLTGGDGLSPGAHIAAMQAAQMGGDAGRAMFDSYYKNNADHFDGSHSIDAVLNKANGPHTEKPDSGKTDPERTGATKTGDDYAKLVGTTGDDTLTAGNRSQLWGNDSDDTLRARYDAILNGGDGNDILIGGDRSTLFGDDGDDTLTGNNSTLYGGNGNDTLSGSGSTLYGEDGDDKISGYNNSNLYGGAGNDRLDTYGNSRINGGAGNDYITGYDNLQVQDTEGDNYISAYSQAAVTTGNGNDWITAYDKANIRAGNGNNMINTYGKSSVASGDGADRITVGVESTVDSGSGDDMIKAGSGSTLHGGAGDDRITIQGDTTVHFARGDGNDIIGGGEWGQAYNETENLSSSVIAFGDGITASDLSFQSQGNDLIINAGHGDSITLKDYQRHGIPAMTFTDGSAISSADIVNAVGPGEAYKPANEAVQKWHDANAAYKSSSQSDGKTDITT